MDDRGRFAQSLNGLRDNLRPMLAAGMKKLISLRAAHIAAKAARKAKAPSKTELKAARRAKRRARETQYAASPIGRLARHLHPLADLPFPRGSGIAASLILIFGFATYGVVKGD